jgi:carboxyl-terminal processing protease
LSALNRSRSLFLTLSLAVLLPVATGVLWSAVATRGADEGEDSVYKYLSIFSEVFGLVRSSYVDAPDVDILLGGAIDGVGDALDPFSNVVPAAAMAEYQRTLEIGTTLSGLRLAKEQGLAFVVAVEEGSPAAAAGLERGDLVAEIDGQDTRVTSLWRLESRLAGAAGEQLVLRTLRDGESEKRTLTLAEYSIPQPRVEQVESLPMLILPRIDSAAVGKARELLGGLVESGAERLLIDLRSVAGGDVEAAYALGALFASGELGGLETRGEERREFRSDAEPLWDGRTVVLVDGGTLGPAEVLAAILRDGAGGELVGVRTFGWAGERTFVELSSGARLHLTTAFYTGPEGEPLSGGVAPDIVVDELSRSLDERDRSLRELILERGVDRLLGSDTERRVA